MATHIPQPGEPVPDPRRPDGDPLRMTEAEKRMAEWEARHDVAARGHRAGPDGVQHYLAHERLQQPPGRPPVSRPVPPHREPSRRAEPAPDASAGPHRGWWRRLFGRRG